MNSMIKMFQSSQGEKNRFCTALRPHIELMFKMAWVWTQSEEDAEDLVQDVLTRLAEKPEKLHEIDNLRPWLVRVTYNRYVDLYRRDKASPVDIAGLDDEIDCADPHADDIDQVTTKEALDRGLEQLVPEQRDTVILHEIQGCSDKETAAILNVSVGTVKSRLHRAKQKMRDTLLQGTITQVRSC